MLPDDAGPSQWRSTANGDLFALTYSSIRPAGIIRFDAAGNLDPSFGTGGVVVPQCGSCFLERFTLLADQRIATTQASIDGYPEVKLFTGRFSAQGLPDSSYGAGGVQSLMGTARGQIFGITSTALGDMYLSSSASSIFQNSENIIHVGASGTIISQFGQVSEDSAGARYAYRYARLLAQPDGRLLAATPGPENGLALNRFALDQPDLSFGTGGRTIVVTPGPGRSTDVATSPDGIVVVGVAEQDGIAQIGVARTDDHGAADSRFGGTGLVIVKVARAGEAVSDVRAYSQISDGSVVVAATIQGELSPYRPFYRIAIVRLRNDGSLDYRFAPGGVAELWQQWGTRLTYLASGPNGSILIGGEVVTVPNLTQPRTRPAMFRLQGGSMATAMPSRERRAVEYFHKDFGHYFITADPSEIATLDMAFADAWTRTGKTFAVFDEPGSGLYGVCRFWSDQSFAPKSSHFYTPYPNECTTVRAGSIWTFERIAFYFTLPVGAEGARTCLSGTQPLYRAYNARIGSAPNHRYTIDVATLDQMVAQGWIMEGEAQTKVFACTPAMAAGQ
jgi:uncharacterized delta-60 repeat protein